MTTEGNFNENLRKLYLLQKIKLFMISVLSLEQNQSAFDVENESFSQNFHFIVELHFIDRKRFPIRKISCTWMFRDVKSLPAIGNRRKGR